MGQSLGGAISTFLAVELAPISNFSGAILFAPAIKSQRPHWILEAILENTFGVCMPEEQMPPFLSKANDTSKMFTTQELIDFLERDKWGEEGGLGWGQSMRWGTGDMRLHSNTSIV